MKEAWKVSDLLSERSCHVSQFGEEIRNQDGRDKDKDTGQRRREQDRVIACKS